MEAIQKAMPLLGRILIAQIFLMSGVNKIMGFSDVIGAVPEYIPFPAVALGIAVALEIIGGLMVLIGFKTRIGALLLLIFLIPITVIFQWNFGTQQAIIAFSQHLAMIGGLVYILGFGSGAYSVDGEEF